MDAITAKVFHLSKTLSNTTKSLKQIQILHQKTISLGLQNNTSLCKNLINLYVSIGAHQSAESIFKNIESPSDITLWNGLMSAYAKNSMFSEVFSLFETLLQNPHLRPDSYTYPSLLKACGGLKRVDYGERVHTHLIKTGSLSDVVVASSLTSLYAKCSVFSSAVKLFDEMPYRDLPCWNNVISCYYQSGQWEKALEYFERMKRTGLRPDSVSFTTAISACSRLSDLEKGRKIHEEVLSSGLVMDAYVSSTLIDMYGKCGCLDRAKEIFDKISDRSLVCWNSMIGGHSQAGDSASCIRLLARMNRAKVRPSLTTVSTILVACAKSAQLLHGRFVHGYAIRNNLFGDVFVESSLLDFYFKCGCVATAEKVFNLMPKSEIVVWNVMISGYVSSGTYLEALETYDQMRVEGVKPDAITLTTLLSACSQLAALEKGKEFHTHINENRLNSNEVVMGALLDMYAKCGAVNEAVLVFNQLPKKDLVSWTSMIVAHGSHGQVSEAMKTFDEMLRANLKPDRVTFLAVISACSHAGLVEKGRSYFNLMVDEYKIRPTTAEYSCLVDLFCRAGRLHEAYEILEKNSLIKEDDDLLSTLFAACHLRGDLLLGEKIASILVEKGSDDMSIYVCLEKMYATGKKWDEARKVRSKMKELGLKKSPGCSWIEVDERIESFLAGDYKTCARAESVYDCLSIMYGHTEKKQENC
ncbi:Pentatricopeptide repeat-containing protein [Striga hermonthica]|uniref:Pentatricopeptide repeat-containing protein n=1 Tax=Striga hermonthica TaxID=68872 RepID=A0A9N7MQF2_STRHE|nr:Pentatricopeptide repeat-containing protein [Striga hermonthica]